MNKKDNSNFFNRWSRKKNQTISENSKIFSDEEKINSKKVNQLEKDELEKEIEENDLSDFDEKETSLFLEGRIDLLKNKVKFKNIVKNKNQKFDRKDILSIEKNFNEFVIDRSLLGITDFFGVLIIYSIFFPELFIF